MPSVLFLVGGWGCPTELQRRLKKAGAVTSVMYHTTLNTRTETRFRRYEWLVRHCKNNSTDIDDLRVAHYKALPGKFPAIEIAKKRVSVLVLAYLTGREPVPR